MNGTQQVLAYTDDVSLIGDDIETKEINEDMLLNDFNDIDLAVNIGQNEVHGSRTSSRHDGE